MSMCRVEYTATIPAIHMGHELVTLFKKVIKACQTCEGAIEFKAKEDTGEINSEPWGEFSAENVSGWGNELFRALLEKNMVILKLESKHTYRSDDEDCSSTIEDYIYNLKYVPSHVLKEVLAMRQQ